MATRDPGRAVPPHLQADPADRGRQRQHRQDRRAAGASRASRGARRCGHRPATWWLRSRGRRGPGRRDGGRRPAGTAPTATSDHVALAAARRRRTGRRHPPAAARPRGHRPQRGHHRPQAGLPRRRHDPVTRSARSVSASPARAGASSGWTSARSTRASATNRSSTSASPPAGCSSGSPTGAPSTAWIPTSLLPGRGRAGLAGHRPRPPGRHHSPRRDGAPPGGSGRTAARGAGGRHPDRVDQQLGLLLVLGHAPTWRLPFTWLRLVWTA